MRPIYSVNFLSIWRLQTIVENQAATWPVLDPTWYGPKSIVLAAIEVDLASICASVPVFWPVLTESFGKIFVTQEVHVTHTHRRLSGEDGYELRRPDELDFGGGGHGGSGSVTPGGHHSRLGSEASLSKPGSRQMMRHYSSHTSVHDADKQMVNNVTPLGVAGHHEPHPQQQYAPIADVHAGQPPPNYHQAAGGGPAGHHTRFGASLEQKSFFDDK